MSDESTTKASIISLPYFGNILHHSRIKAHSPILEAFENYQKRSYRNKTTILGANGPLLLSVPLLKGKHSAQFYKDVKIAYHDNWVKSHLESLQSAYSNSAYYDYYYPSFESTLKKNHHFLWDLNMELRQILRKNLHLSEEEMHSEIYLRSQEYNLDFRNEKAKIGVIKEVKYFQVFEDKMGFIPDLSILDLLFNTGPEAFGLL